MFLTLIFLCPWICCGTILKDGYHNLALIKQNDSSVDLMLISKRDQIPMKIFQFDTLDKKDDEFFSSHAYNGTTEKNVEISDGISTNINYLQNPTDTGDNNTSLKHPVTLDNSSINQQSTLGQFSNPAKSCKHLLQTKIITGLQKSVHWILTADGELLQVICPQSHEQSNSTSQLNMIHPNSQTDIPQDKEYNIMDINKNSTNIENKTNSSSGGIEDARLRNFAHEDILPRHQPNLLEALDPSSDVAGGNVSNHSTDAPFSASTNESTTLSTESPAFTTSNESVAFSTESPMSKNLSDSTTFTTKTPLSTAVSDSTESTTSQPSSLESNLTKVEVNKNDTKKIPTIYDLDPYDMLEPKVLNGTENIENQQKKPTKYKELFQSKLFSRHNIQRRHIMVKKHKQAKVVGKTRRKKAKKLKPEKKLQKKPVDRKIPLYKAMSPLVKKKVGQNPNPKQPTGISPQTIQRKQHRKANIKQSRL